MLTLPVVPCQERDGSKTLPLSRTASMKLWTAPSLNHNHIDTVTGGLMHCQTHYTIDSFHVTHTCHIPSLRAHLTAANYNNLHTHTHRSTHIWWLPITHIKSAAPVNKCREEEECWMEMFLKWQKKKTPKRGKRLKTGGRSEVQYEGEGKDIQHVRNRAKESEREREEKKLQKSAVCPSSLLQSVWS